MFEEQSLKQKVIGCADTVLVVSIFIAYIFIKTAPYTTYLQLNKHSQVTGDVSDWRREGGKKEAEP